MVASMWIRRPGDPEPTIRQREHTVRKWGIWTWRFILFGVIGCLLGVGNLYVQQNHYKHCVADYLAYQSDAQQERGAANKAILNSLVDGFVSIQALTAPDHQPPSQKTIDEFYDAVGAVPATRNRYNDATNEYPLQDFTEKCGSGF